MPSRRDLFRTTAASLAAWSLPGSLGAEAVKNQTRNFYFVSMDTRQSFPVADPAAWVLENQKGPILERAALGLASLTPADAHRIVRLVVRRCRLNLVEVRDDRVRVDYWSQNLADLRPFFKTQKLARPEVVVELWERKRETVTQKTGDEYLYGDAINPRICLETLQTKWANRFKVEPDDEQPAPWTHSGYGWPGVESQRIPWKVMKSAWRRTERLPCPNCDGPAILANFGLLQTGFMSKSPRFTQACPPCRRWFQKNPEGYTCSWIKANLDPDVHPEYWVFWGKRRPWTAP